MRKRLQELNRGPLAFKKKPAEEREKARGTQRAAAARQMRAGPFQPPEPEQHAPVSLEKAAPGEVVETPAGTLYIVRKSYRELMEQPEDFLRKYRQVFVDGTASWREGALHPDLRQLLAMDPCRALFIDIETTGLIAMPLFLIGVMSYSGSDFGLQLLFARDYSEECAVIAHFARMLHDCDALVTFNGKAFDLPYIADRGVVHGVNVTYSGLHVDLLHEARRRWRGRLPDCRLQTLERFLCERVRVGDIPGAQIPQAYHDFVSSGDAHLMAVVLQHNALDLVAMSEILLCMIRRDEQ